MGTIYSLVLIVFRRYSRKNRMIFTVIFGLIGLMDLMKPTFSPLFEGDQNQIRVRRWLPKISLILACVIFLSPLSAIPRSDEPNLTPSFIRQLQDLPYGISKQRCLILRYRHVGSIQFYGSASNSGFSFQRGRSLIPEGLSLRLKNQGNFSWASGVIKFKQPLNVTKYNSILLWVRTSHPGLKFWLGVQDPNWLQPEIYQARTDILPVRGFPTHHAVQLVIPFKVIYAESPVNYAALSQVAFEFGEDTVGNFKEGDIEVLGVAFVKQATPLNRVKLVVKEIKSRAPTSVISKPASQGISTSLETGTAEVMTPEPMKNVKPSDREPGMVSHLVDMGDTQAAELFNQFGYEMKTSPPPPVIKERTWPERLFPFAKGWSIPFVGRLFDTNLDSAQSSSAGLSNKNKIIIQGMLYLLLAGLLFVWWMHRQKSKTKRTGRLSKVLHEVRWLFSQMDLPATERYEEDFWKGLAAKNMRFAWLSTVGASVVRSAEDQFYGEDFLKRQVRRAAECGIRLFPSLSFVRTVFNYETFLANPTLFHIRQINPEDYQMNDDELRVKEKDCFPIWIPPFWQKKFRLPHRVLVEYGKSIGFPHSRDSVEFNRSSTALRKIAVQTIDKFAVNAPGVRIENATWLLNSKISGRKPTGTNAPREFWSEVIGAIKEKHPGFLFLADGVGEEARAILNVGFDYFEDDYFMETLVRQIRMGQVGNLPQMLSGEWSELLKYAIFNITRLLRPLPASETIQRQNLLGAILLTLLPGIIQHDDNLPEELDRFLKWTSHSTVFRKGKFSALRSGVPSVLSFARWKRRSLYIAAANFSSEAQEAVIRLDPVLEGIDENKLYLFNNALHGASPLKSILDQSAPSSGPALALWGQGLRDTGIPLRLPAYSLKLFSVNLTRPITSPFLKEPVAALKTVR